MTHAVPAKLDAVRGDREPDVAFVVFASPEDRCLGAARRFASYRARTACILRITDEECPERERNLDELVSLCTWDEGPVVCPTTHADPLAGLNVLAQAVRAANRGGGRVTVDISTFPKISLLLTLKALQRLGSDLHFRLLYTEPGKYKDDLREPLSYGLRRVTVVPTFAAPYVASQELTLVMFLGYERDRALGLWQSVEPHRTLAVIGRPAYHPEWEGVSERLNAALLAGVGGESIFSVDPRNPLATYAFLKNVVHPRAERQRDNLCLAPLGTKPQCVGMYYFCSRFPRSATVIYASPLEPNHAYLSKGVGSTWILPQPP